MEGNFYVELLLGDLENYILSQKSEINNIVSKKQNVSVEETALILDKFSKSLKKTVNIMDFIEEIDNIDTLRSISILASETIAWILFTLPSVEKNLPYFSDDITIYNKHIVDYLADILLEFEGFIENPMKLKFIGKDLQENIKDISTIINYMSNILKKGLIEN
ncbi:MAG: hypothetical protein GXO21_05545 [Aquificae bacterium]|nr:hypothetical protein [Aquificota bacterium]